MKPHLIVLDLDGTLLTDEKIISDKTKLTLKKAEEKGHHIMIATGRPYRASEVYYRQLGLKTPIVNFNGAFVHHPDDHSWKTIHETISLPVVKDVIDAMQQFTFHNIVAEVMDDVYMHYHDEKLLDYFWFWRSQNNARRHSAIFASRSYKFTYPCDLTIKSMQSAAILVKYMQKSLIIDNGERHGKSLKSFVMA